MTSSERQEIILLTPREAATQLTVPETTVREWLKRHKIPRVTIGKRLRVQRRVVDDIKSGHLKVGRRGEWRGKPELDSVSGVVGERFSPHNGSGCFTARPSGSIGLAMPEGPKCSKRARPG